MALGDQQLQLRMSHRCNRGAKMADRGAAPIWKHNNPEASKVAGKYDVRLPWSIMTIGT